MSVTSIRLQAEVEALLEDLARRLDRSKSYLINQAIKEYLERQVLEGERWRETLTAIASVNSGKRIAEAEVTALLESWGTENEAKPPSA